MMEMMMMMMMIESVVMMMMVVVVVKMGTQFSIEGQEQLCQERTD